MISLPVLAVSGRKSDEQHHNRLRRAAICDKERLEHRCANQKIRFWDTNLFLQYITLMMFVVNASLGTGISSPGAKFTESPWIASCSIFSAVVMSSGVGGGLERIFFLKAISVSKAFQSFVRSASAYKHRAQIMV